MTEDPRLSSFLLPPRRPRPLMRKKLFSLDDDDFLLVLVVVGYGDAVIGCGCLGCDFVEEDIDTGEDVVVAALALGLKGENPFPFGLLILMIFCCVDALLLLVLII